MVPSNHEYNGNTSSRGAHQTILRDVGRDVNIRLQREWDKHTKGIILSLMIFVVIAIPAITVPVYLKVHSR